MRGYCYVYFINLAVMLILALGFLQMRALYANDAENCVHKFYNAYKV